VITDTGRGIVQESLPRIFERFYSENGTNGTGLGLAIVQQICELHGWRIEVESEPGAGSSFRVTFT
jgi:two-component system phosphate regulon sensor histidine kinase PhoR